MNTGVEQEQQNLRLRKQAIDAVIGRRNRPINTVLERYENELAKLTAELEKAREEDGVTEVPARVYSRDWQNSVDNQTLEWVRGNKADGVLEGLQVGVEFFSFDKPQCGDFCTYTEIRFKGKPPRITLSLTAKVKEGRRVLHAKKGNGKGQFEDVTRGVIPTLNIDISWNGNTPVSANARENYTNVIFMDPDGSHMVQLEISVTTRYGRFWLAIQELFAGQIGRTTEARAKKMQLKYVPLEGGFVGVGIPAYPENNYPGSSYADNFRDEAQFIINYAVAQSFISPLSKCSTPPVWNPGPVPEMSQADAMSGFEVGVVLFFNITLGWGFVRLQSGQTVFTHFKSILGKDGKPESFPLIEPMRYVAIRHIPGDNNGRKANAVRYI